jgi:hypothetical protein
MSFDIDLTPMWTAVETNLPVFIGILAPILGISVAVAIVKWFGKAIVDAFKGL